VSAARPFVSDEQATMCVQVCPGEGQRGKNHQAGQVRARGRGAAMYRGDRFRARTEGSYQLKWQPLG
jgi:hypothetical protein